MSSLFFSFNQITRLYIMWVYISHSTKINIPKLCLVYNHLLKIDGFDLLYTQFIDIQKCSSNIGLVFFYYCVGLKLCNTMLQINKNKILFNIHKNFYFFLFLIIKSFSLFFVKRNDTIKLVYIYEMSRMG